MAHRRVENPIGYEIIECEPDALHHSIRFPEDRVRFAEEIEQMANLPKQFALIQSTVGIDAVEVAKAFERITKRRQFMSSSVTQPR